MPSPEPKQEPKKDEGTRQEPKVSYPPSVIKPNWLWVIVFAILCVALIGTTIWLAVTGSAAAIATGIGAAVSGFMAITNYKKESQR